MKINLVRVLSILNFFIFILPSLHAATYYVSTSGSDSNPGNQISPWKNCPGMIGWSGKGQLNPGDTVFFKNADTWSSSSIPAYGSYLQLKAGVTYNGRSWGNGSRATITASGLFDICDIVSLYEDHPSIATIFDGFQVLPKIHASAIALDWPAQSYNMTGATKRIVNCTVDGMGQTNSGECYGITAQPYNGAMVQNVEIINNTVKNIRRDGIYLYPGNEDLPNLVIDVLVKGNECYLDGRDPTSFGAGITLKNHVRRAIIEYNYIHDTYGSAMAITSGATDQNLHIMPGPEDCTIRYNIITNWNYLKTPIYHHSDYANAGLIIYDKMPRSAWIYGNIFWNQYAWGGIEISYLTVDPIQFKIYNNIINGGYGPAIANHAYNNNAQIDITNNILLNNEGGVIFYDVANIVNTHKSNIYWRASDGNLVSINDGQIIYKAANLANWEPTAFSSNPSFKNINNLPTGFLTEPMRPNKDGLSILKGNAIEKGTNLESPYDGSINGILRGTIWDIGPYQAAPAAHTRPAYIGEIILANQFNISNPASY